MFERLLPGRLRQPAVDEPAVLLPAGQSVPPQRPPVAAMTRRIRIVSEKRNLAMPPLRQNRSRILRRLPYIAEHRIQLPADRFVRIEHICRPSLDHMLHKLFAGFVIEENEHRLLPVGEIPERLQPGGNRHDIDRYATPAGGRNHPFEHQLRKTPVRRSPGRVEHLFGSGNAVDRRQNFPFLPAAPPRVFGDKRPLAAHTVDQPLVIKRLKRFRQRRLAHLKPLHHRLDGVKPSAGTRPGRNLPPQLLAELLMFVIRLYHSASLKKTYRISI